MSLRLNLAAIVIGSAFVAAAPSAVAPAAAQPANPASDAWGIPKDQWVRLPAPELRRRLGFPAAAPQFLAAAERGDAHAMALISSAYATGAGVPKNPAEAIRWAQRAADTGLPFGLHVLALDYFYGTGVAASHSRYLDLLRKAADAGSILAASEFAQAHFVGEITPKNFAVAKPYAKIGAEGGDAKSKMLYGTLLFDRSLSNPDPVAAAKWVRAAAGDGFPFAQQAARALQVQDEISELAKKLFVSNFGNVLVGAYTLSARIEDPCVTRLVVEHNGVAGVFLINWQETSVATAGDSFLNLAGAILNGTDRVGGDVRTSLGLSLHRDQLEAPEERDRMLMLGDAARTLSTVCQTL